MESLLPATIKLSSRYIVPFTFDKSTLPFNNLASISTDWEIAPRGKAEMDVYDYISNSFITVENMHSIHTSTAIACIYRYKALPQNFELLYQNKDANYRFIIRSINLILFQNGIGLLWYAPEFKSEFTTVDEAVTFNYYFKELARSSRENYLFKDILYDYNDTLTVPEDSILPGRKKYKVTESFSMGVWIATILDTLNCHITFYPFRNNNKENIQIPDKALLFHHGVFSLDSVSIKSAYYLTRGYKASYKISDSIEEEMLHPFDNLYCFATSEGCGYFAYADTSNQAFFSNPTKVMSDYFLLYTLLLYQSYSLLMYSECISKNLSGNTHEYESHSPQLVHTLNTLSTDLNIFLAKSIYSSVSYVQHQNDFYEYVSKKLRIAENISSVSAGIDALRNLEIHLETEENTKKNASLETGITLISLLAIFSAFVDANEFVRNYLWNMFDYSQPIEVWIINAIVLIITFAVILCCLRFIRLHFQLWKKNKKHNK